ncbi:MAG: hypothetical protein AB7V27_02000 [Candidatus Binatia bacterium]
MRERRDDIPLLAVHFAALAARKLGIATPDISARQCEKLRRHAWRGNARELQNLIERAVILSCGGRLRLDGPDGGTARARPPEAPPSDEVVPEGEWRRRERANVLAALKHAGGRIYGNDGAAELLGIKPSTLDPASRR